MNKERLNNIINGDLQLTKADLEEIKSLTTEFPFCQIGHVLSAVAHKQHEHMLSEEKIITAAIHTVSRKKLRLLINKNQPNASTNNIQVEHSKSDTYSDDKINVLKDVENKSNLKHEQSIQNTEYNKNKRDTISEELEETLAALQEKKRVLEKKPPNDIEPEIPSTEEKLVTDKTPLYKNRGTITPKDTNEKPYRKKESNTISSSRLGDEFSQNDLDTSGSFTDIMLDYLKTLEERRATKPSKTEQVSIIDTFIERDPNISRSQPFVKKIVTDDLAKESVSQKKPFISENLAKINAKQGNISNAINIYEQLILKYPEKKSYFVIEIEKLR